MPRGGVLKVPIIGYDLLKQSKLEENNIVYFYKSRFSKMDACSFFL